MNRPHSPPTAIALTLRQHALYPNHYCWYVLVCALDLIMTATILAHFGGIEINGLANRIIDLAGLPGLIVFKFASVVLVVAICETIGRKRQAAGRRLAEWAIAISAIPFVFAIIQLAAGVATGCLPV